MDLEGDNVFVELKDKASVVEFVDYLADTHSIKFTPFVKTLNADMKFTLILRDDNKDPGIMESEVEFLIRCMWCIVKEDVEEEAPVEIRDFAGELK
jgi:hypothetical protein